MKPEKPTLFDRVLAFLIGGCVGAILGALFTFALGCKGIWQLCYIIGFVMLCGVGACILETNSPSSTSRKQY